MALWRLYYHLVWTTKERHPLINPERETKLYAYIVNKSDRFGSIIHAIGGVEDHVHLVVSIPPTLASADFVKNIKGGSAHHLNHSFLASPGKFGWQEGYGIFSLGGKQLEEAVSYVKNQKEHHLSGTAITLLEQAPRQNDSPKAWNSD